ncbi:ribonuclease HII [Candidatus Dojkabacteria bacterium]|nr:ribonuclease HII [Candidatus Dojkabacteria bacterium]
MEKEQKIWKTQPEALIAGIDEAGRGPLAGPVVVGIVVIKHENQYIQEVRDSKTLSELQREKIFEKITKTASAWGYAMRDNQFIDERGIVHAVRESVVDAYYSLNPKPNLALIDGSYLRNFPFEYKSFDKGDRDIYCIAAASIIAKVIRDRLIVKLDSTYPEYGFAKHKGYGTMQHIEAIRKYGLSDVHRVSFCSRLIINK